MSAHRYLRQTSITANWGRKVRSGRMTTEREPTNIAEAFQQSHDSWNWNERLFRQVFFFPSLLNSKQSRPHPPSNTGRDREWWWGKWLFASSTGTTAQRPPPDAWGWGQVLDKVQSRACLLLPSTVIDNEGSSRKYSERVNAALCCQDEQFQFDQSWMLIACFARWQERKSANRLEGVSISVWLDSASTNLGVVRRAGIDRQLVSKGCLDYGERRIYFKKISLYSRDKNKARRTAHHIKDGKDA